MGTGLLLYAKALAAPFLLDDGHYISSHLSWPRWYDFPALFFRDSRAVMTVSLLFNYTLGKLDPWGYHLFNILVHSVNSLLLWGLIRRTLHECPGRVKTMAEQIAFSASFLWLIHPLASQPVVYIIQRAELMMSTAYLASLYAMVRGHRSSRQAWWWLVVVLCCLVGLYAKLVAVTIPLTLLLYDRTFLEGRFFQALRMRRWMYLGLVATWGMLLVTGATALLNPHAEMASAGLSMQILRPVQYLFAQSEVILHYLRLCVWPDVLIFDYGWPPRPIETYLTTFVVMVCLFGITAWLVWRRPRVGFLPACVFLVLGPTSSLVPIADLAVEHRMYLPLAAVVLMIVLGLFVVLSEKHLRGLYFLLVILALMLGGRTWVRLGDYRDGITLWKTVVAASPTFPRGRLFLGNELDHAGYLDQAAYQYEQILADHPDYLMAYSNLSRYWLIKGNLDKALAFGQKAVELSDQSKASYLSHLARIYLTRKNLDKAQYYYQQALKISPNHPSAMLGLGSAYAMLGHWRQADKAFADLLSVQPENPDALQRRAWLLATCPDDRVRRGVLAIQLAKRGLALTKGHNWPLRDALAAAYAETGQFEAAIHIINETLDLVRQQPLLLKLFNDRKQYYQQCQPYRLAPKKKTVPK